MPRDLGHAPDLDQLNARFAGDPLGAIVYATRGPLGPTALVSSFGAESAVLLHMAAQVDRHLPVIFIDTLLLFPETLSYQRDLATHLGLTDVRRITPDRVDMFLHDPEIALHGADPDACCDLRKARPLDRALAPFTSWISGRKRFQNGLRAGLEMFEHDPDSGKTKINPLAGFTANDLRTYSARHNLPRHPLVARGFPSIGCTPCTSKVEPDEDSRAGRWRGRPKTECGIHFSGGKLVRGNKG
jgi:phosphoadenosine phosphosulfate reductase